LRVLVTASREHIDPVLIAMTLNQIYQDWCENHPEDTEFVVVHGDARGGDQIAKNWAMSKRSEDLRVNHESHPADWDRYHRAAGHVRNEKMVRQGADCCLAFPIGKSPGTRGCLRLAKKANIPTRVYEPAHSWKCK
jgi:hypothetical protein